MKIGIDYREAIKQEKAGKGVVVAELMAEFKKVVPTDWRVDLLVHEDFDMTDFPDNFHKVTIKWPGLLWHLRVVWEVWWKYDVYLALTSFMVPRLSMSKKCIVMVHDLIAFMDEFSTRHSPKALWNERLTVAGALKSVGKIIVPSVGTKNDLIKMFGVDDRKIFLMVEGVNKIPAKIDVEAAKNKYSLSSDYLFFVSTIEPRKNIIRLIEAFVRFKQEKNWSGKLVVAGKKGWYYEDVFRKVKELAADDDIIFTGRVSDEEKFALIKGAKCLCYPSLYEGFGLPVLEGMVMGTPVLTSNVSSLPEVAGEAAVLVDPRNVVDISQGIKKIVLDQELAPTLVARGYEQVKKFSWQKAAAELVKLIININAS
ncbi:MAG: glycosyltransferase family 1 protein [Patescibacteria group bacterium]